MNMSEALIEAVSGHMVTGSHMQLGSWVDYTITSGFIRHFPGDMASCAFNSNPDDKAADWQVVLSWERDGWGNIAGVIGWDPDNPEMIPVGDPAPELFGLLVKDEWGKPK